MAANLIITPVKKSCISSLCIQVADATAHMVEAAKGCASSPKDRDQQQQLRHAAEELRAATTAAASSALKKKIIKKLEVGVLLVL